MRKHKMVRWGAVALMTLVVAGGTWAVAQVTATTTKQTQAAATPESILDALKAGNERFVLGDLTERDWLAQVKTTASGQYPLAAIVGCIDSRVPPEVIFDMGIGDLFVARVAGNYVETDILGSLEFATKVAGSKVIVVLGHSECGAVKGACDNVELGNLTHTLSNVMPAVYATRGVPGERSSKNKALVRAVTETNVRHNVENVVERSAVIRALVDDEQVEVVGAIYDVSTGRVTFLD